MKVNIELDIFKEHGFKKLKVNFISLEKIFIYMITWIMKKKN